MNNLPPIIVDLISRFNDEKNPFLKHNFYVTLDAIKTAIERATSKYKQDYINQQNQKTVAEFRTVRKGHK